MGAALVKVVLTEQGNGTTYTYDNDSTTNRILGLHHPEQEWSQVAQVIVDNRDGNLTDLALEGYQGVISYGYKTSAGDEYSATAPLEVISQKTDTLLRVGDLLTSFGLAGVFNMMGEDRASVVYSPDRINTDTVKTILTAIAEASMTCFSHCKAYTITFDSEDSLIDSYKPADYFSVAFNESRLSAFKKALKYTKCKAIIKADGVIHVFVPTVSGSTWLASTAYVLNDYVQPTTPNNNFTYRCTTAGTSDSSQPTWPTTAGNTVNDNTVVWTAVAFDYEYNDAIAAANHNFFDKSVRKRLVLPNKIVVSSHPDHPAPLYTGNATDSGSYDAIGRYLTSHKYLRAISNAQCTAIAEAMMQDAQMTRERGHGLAPMNCGQELFDYVKITDSVASDTRVGNVGYINREYNPEKFEFEFRFGSLGAGGLVGTVPPQMSGAFQAEDLVSLVNELIDVVNQLSSTLNDVITVVNGILDFLNAQQQDALFAELSVTETLQVPQGTDKYV